MEPYAVYLHVELLEIVPTRGGQRKKILSFVRGLGESPHTLGDFTDQDTDLRTRQIRIVGNFAVTYWADDAAKCVMVVDIKPADR